MALRDQFATEAGTLQFLNKVKNHVASDSFLKSLGTTAGLPAQASKSTPPIDLEHESWWLVSSQSSPPAAAAAPSSCERDDDTTVDGPELCTCFVRRYVIRF